MASKAAADYTARMAKSVITPEEGAELERLKGVYLAATRRAMDAIRIQGMDSDAFAKADGEAGDAMRRMKEILGLAGKHWMAT
jgi:hypothetical protein